MDKKHNLPITSDDEWGNIELPGLSDEELFSKDWIQSGISSERMKKRNLDPEFRKKTAERNSKVMKKLNLDPEFQKRKSKRSSNTMIKLNSDSEFKKRETKRKKKPVKTFEGIFDSVTSWSRFVKMSDTAFYGRMKKFPDQYYYITWEEYDKLTKQQA